MRKEILMNNEEKLKDEGYPPAMILLAIFFTITIALLSLTVDKGNVYQRTLVFFGSIVAGPFMAAITYIYFGLVFWIFEELYIWSKDLLLELGVPTALLPSLAIALAVLLIFIIPF